MKKNIEWLKNEILGLSIKARHKENNQREWHMGHEMALFDVNKLIDQLDEPEKPVIPQFVADWIDTHNLYGNNPLREYRDLENDFNEGWTNEKDAAVYHWVNENPYAFIDALRYGYEVEKEKKWVVKQRKLYLKSFDIWREEGNNAEFVFDKESTIKFTDKSKAEAVALLVDGTVAEVTE